MNQLILAATMLEKQAKVRELMNQYDTGHQFIIVNVKADGTLREYKAMTNVQAGLKGQESTTAHKPNLITIFDTVANEYRAVNLDTVLFIDFGTNQFIFSDESSADKIKDKSFKLSIKTAASITQAAVNVIKRSLSV